MSTRSNRPAQTVVRDQVARRAKEAANSGALPIGTRIGPYRLCLEIGRGGMARVYLARCEGRPGAHGFVALKCIAEAYGGDANYVQMFSDEARIATLLTHPHVCPVIDYGEAEGVHYLAMPYLVGQTLDHVITKLAMPIGDLPGELTEARRAALLARIVADACEGLHSAHELRDTDGTALDVVHRDVSPPNLMVTFDGCVKVLDFGVASAVDQLHETRTGQVKGKFSYIQPEVLTGRAPDRRADVWGLGVVLWELLTGRRLFRRHNDAATLQAVIGAEIPSPSGMRAGIPEVYDAVVLRALQREPRNRYPSARAMGRDLNACLSQQGLALGMADLADLLNLLFPGTAAARRELVHVMAQVEESTTIALAAHQVEIVEEVRPIDSQASPRHMPPPPPPPRPKRGPGTRMHWTMAGTAFALGLLGVVAGASLSRVIRPPVASEVAPVTPAPTLVPITAVDPRSPPPTPRVYAAPTLDCAPPDDGHGG